MFKTDMGTQIGFLVTASQARKHPLGVCHKVLSAGLRGCPRPSGDTSEPAQPCWQLLGLCLSLGTGVPQKVVFLLVSLSQGAASKTTHPYDCSGSLASSSSSASHLDFPKSGVINRRTYAVKTSQPQWGKPGSILGVNHIPSSRLHSAHCAVTSLHENLYIAHPHLAITAVG